MKTINFNGPINNENLCAFINATTPINNNGEELKINFTSEGGEINYGFAMYEYIRSLKVPTIIHNFGNVDSIGVIVFLAVDERWMTPNSRFLIHELSFDIKMNMTLKQLEQHVSLLSTYVNRYADIFVQRTKGAKDHIDIRNALTDQLILDASNSLAAGLVTRIADADGTMM